MFKELFENTYRKVIRTKTQKINGKQATTYFFKYEDEAEDFYKEQKKKGNDAEWSGANLFVNIYEEK